MTEYKETYRLETEEVDASIEAAFEYRSMLEALEADDLPRFEARFKELLNENTIREVANFQSQLAREREQIKERITRINESLAQIDYNPARYIRLEARPSPDAEIRDFQNELRACTEGSLTGSADAQYSEAKFLQVKHIIERFRGREGRTELDRRWTSKVTDVRNGFMFAASERWREDDSEHEHYSDSGGKSGGQKEKLAYIHPFDDIDVMAGQGTIAHEIIRQHQGRIDAIFVAVGGGGLIGGIAGFLGGLLNARRFGLRHAQDGRFQPVVLGPAPRSDLADSAAPVMRRVTG